uniref:Aromatic-L-amino-acid decarboxylase n=1 Tax=Angiostrongylus cantonensis TaxID=6313 RepID=A0A158P6D9_ANGCA
MNSNEFRKYGKEMVDYVADFWDHIRERRPLPNIKPGYIKDVVPSNAPPEPEDWNTIFNDLEEVVMKGNTYWHHPHFFAYFPTACSYPALIADILSGGIAGIGFSWKSGPAMTELEMATLDWLVDALALPEHFKNSHPGNGCGIIQCTASDATMIAVMSARAKAVEAEQEHADILYPHFHDPAVFQNFVAYCSDQEDRARGLIPFILIATMGTTSSCGMDRLNELAPICNREHIWLHVDAAYAGSFLTCPEFRYMFKDGVTVTKYFNVDATYLKHEYQAVAADYRHLQVALGRRFRALKIWFVLRKLGVAYIQSLLRKVSF